MSAGRFAWVGSVFQSLWVVASDPRSGSGLDRCDAASMRSPHRRAPGNGRLAGIRGSQPRAHGVAWRPWRGRRGRGCGGGLVGFIRTARDSGRTSPHRGLCRPQSGVPARAARYSPGAGRWGPAHSAPTARSPVGPETASRLRGEPAPGARGDRASRDGPRTVLDQRGRVTVGEVGIPFRLGGRAAAGDGRPGTEVSGGPGQSGTLCG
jgi:hypothetical protein